MCYHENQILLKFSLFHKLSYDEAYWEIDSKTFAFMKYLEPDLKDDTNRPTLIPIFCLKKQAGNFKFYQLTMNYAYG